MSSDDRRNPEKPLEEAPEDDEIQDLLAGMRQGGPPKLHAKVQPDAMGTNAAQYAHEPREPYKGKDTLKDLAPILLNATPVPNRSETAARDSATEPGARKRAEPPREDNVAFETLPGVRRTRNLAITLALAFAGAALVVGIALLLRRTPSTSTASPPTATPSVAVSPPNALSAIAVPTTPPAPPEPVVTASAPIDPPRRTAQTAPRPIPAPIVKTAEPPIATKQPTPPAPPPPATTAAPPPANVPGLDDLVPPSRQK